MSAETSEQNFNDTERDAAYFIELKKCIQQLIEEVERCSLRADSSRQAQAIKQQVAALLVALKERCLLPYDAPALLRPQDIRECHACGTQDLVTRMTPVIRHPSGTQGYTCARCAPARSNTLWYAP